jgi:hypothetical protein
VAVGTLLKGCQIQRGHQGGSGDAHAPLPLVHQTDDPTRAVVRVVGNCSYSFFHYLNILPLRYLRAMMNPVLTQRLVAIAEAASAAGHGNKEAVYQAACEELCMSRATLLKN